MVWIFSGIAHCFQLALKAPREFACCSSTGRLFQRNAPEKLKLFFIKFVWGRGRLLRGRAVLILKEQCQYLEGCNMVTRQLPLELEGLS